MTKTIKAVVKRRIVETVKKWTTKSPKRKIKDRLAERVEKRNKGKKVVITRRNKAINRILIAEESPEVSKKCSN